MPPKVILASGSVYRRQLLARLGVPFQWLPAAIDETPLPAEDGATLALRLAREKARKVARERPDAVIIGSDQCACLDGRLVGKPATRERAFAQLRAASGRPMEFFTGVWLEVPGEHRQRSHIDRTRVMFRTLAEAEIRRYVDADKPLECAGAFKAEALGIGLFSRIDSHDPSGLIGLPLIALAELLRGAGFEIP